MVFYLTGGKITVDFFNLHWIDANNSKNYNFNDALKSYFKTLNYGNHPYLFIDIADLYYKNGKFKEAEEYYLKGESTLPGKETEFYCDWESLVKFHYEYKKDNEKALKILDDCFKSQINYTLFNSALTISLESKNKNKLIEYLFYFVKHNYVFLRDASKYCDEDKKYLFNDYESEIIEFGLNNLTQPLLNKFCVNMGYNYFDKNNYEKAAEFFKKRLSYEFDITAAVKLAEIYSQNLNNSNEAIKYYLQALVEIEKDEEFYTYKGETISIAKFFLNQNENLERILIKVNQKISDEKYTDDMKDIKARILLKLNDKSAIEYLAKLQWITRSNFSDDLFEKHKTEIQNYTNDHWKNSKETKEEVIKSIFAKYSDFINYDIYVFFDENTVPPHTYFYYWNKLVKDYLLSFIDFDDKYMVILLNTVINNSGFYNFIKNDINLNYDNISAIIRCLLKTKQTKEKIFEAIEIMLPYDEKQKEMFLSIVENLIKNTFTQNDLKELIVFIKNKKIFYSKRELFMLTLLKIDFKKYIKDVLKGIEYTNRVTIVYILKHDKQYIDEIKEIYLNLEYSAYFVDEVLNLINDLSYTKKVVLRQFEDFIEKKYTKPNKNELIKYIQDYLTKNDKSKFNELITENSKIINESSTYLYSYISNILLPNKDDEFFKRALTICLYFDRGAAFKGLFEKEFSENIYTYENLSEFITKYDISMELMVEYAVKDAYYGDFINILLNKETELFFKVIKTLDVNEQRNKVTSFWNYNKEKLYPLAYELLSSSSKPLRADIILLFTRYEEKIDDYKKLLTSKKQQARESGIKLLTNLRIEGIEELLKQLLEKETAEAIKKIIKECLLEISKDKIVKKTEIIDGKMVETIENNIFSNEAFSKEVIIKNAQNFTVKGSKEPVSGVSFLKVSKLPKLLWKDDKKKVDLSVVYYFISLFSITKSSIPSIEGKQVAQFFDKDSLSEFAKEIYNRWNNDTKTKWIFGMISLFGGNYFVPIFKKQIADLVDNNRGTMAAVLVESMALIGTSSALQTVDYISRKIKHSQVKSAAIKSLEIAAKELNFSKDELLDKIIPDFGFDINGKLELDFGTRKFILKLTPEDFMIFDENGKEIKTLPKPNKTDDEQKANEATILFKEIKKEVKEQSKMQKERLESGLSNNRLRNKENWIELFTLNPMMKIFGITLIWGIYFENNLQSTFRYSEDGSLSDINDNPFSLPENCLIGIVHPVELTKEEIDKWKTIMSDYELIQSFKQLERNIYTLKKEKEERELLDDFNGFMVSRGNLKTKFKKFGWEPSNQEQGSFDCFSKYIKDYELNINLEFAGDYIDSYEDQGEEVAIYNVKFFKNNTKLKLKEIPKRLFCEIYNEIKIVSDSGSGFKEDAKKK